MFEQEKRWIRDAELEIAPAACGGAHRVSWFLVRADGEPAGVIRLVYDPPLTLPAEYEVRLEDGLDLERLQASGRFAEIGRFMITPTYRRNFRIALRLMNAAVREVVEGGYTHLLTDVFADDPHSPLHFHTRVLGFQRIGTHRYGELECASARVILLLDLARAYQRMKQRKNKVFREVSRGVAELLEKLPQPATA